MVLHQAVNIPSDTGTPITYEGSTTGPGFNEDRITASGIMERSAEVKKVSIASVETWLADNAVRRKGVPWRSQSRYRSGIDFQHQLTGLCPLQSDIAGAGQPAPMFAFVDEGSEGTTLRCRSGRAF